LYKAAQNEINDGKEEKVHFAEDEHHGNDEAAMSGLNKALIDQHREVNGKPKLTHDQWLRLKEHQRNLRKALISEAKRDLFEKLVQKQAELEIENEERHKRMLEWEENKLIGLERKLDIEKRKNRDEKLKKET
jgi:hypothetical protein